MNLSPTTLATRSTRRGNIAAEFLEREMLAPAGVRSLLTSSGSDETNDQISVRFGFDSSLGSDTTIVFDTLSHKLWFRRSQNGMSNEIPSVKVAANQKTIPPSVRRTQFIVLTPTGFRVSTPITR